MHVNTMSLVRFSEKLHMPSRAKFGCQSDQRANCNRKEQKGSIIVQAAECGRRRLPRFVSFVQTMFCNTSSSYATAEGSTLRQEAHRPDRGP